MNKTAIEIFRNFQRNDIIWTDKYLSKTPFHAGFWVRNRIDQAIASHAHLAHGVLLDVGCGIKPFEKNFAPFVEKYWGLEYSPESGYWGNRADFCADAAELPLPDKSVDTILCTEVFEHLPNPEKTVEEFARILRPGGTVICTAPFVYPIHDKYDFFRYSPDGLAVIMKRHGLVVKEVKPLSGTSVTIALLFNFFWYEMGFIWTKWLYPFGVILRPLFWILIFIVNVLGRLGEIIIPSNHLSFNHLTIAIVPQDND
jgi:SAM-dependent methyltransferase